MTIESQSAPTPVPLPLKRPAADSNSPLARSPSRRSTPPPLDRPHLHTSSKGTRRSGRSTARASTGGVDARDLSRVLSREFSRELSADRRDSAPAASPHRKKRRVDPVMNGPDRLVYTPSSSAAVLAISYCCFCRAMSIC